MLVPAAIEVCQFYFCVQVQIFGCLALLWMAGIRKGSESTEFNEGWGRGSPRLAKCAKHGAAGGATLPRRCGSRWPHASRISMVMVRY